LSATKLLHIFLPTRTKRMGPGGVRNSSVAGISFKIPRGLDQRRLKRATGFQSCWPLDPIAGFKFGHPHKGSAHRKSLIHTGSNCDDHTMLASAHFDPVDSGTGFRKFTFLTGSNNVRNQTALVDSGLWRFETGGQPGMVVCAQKGDRSTYDDGSNCQGCTMNLLAQSRARTNTQYPRRDRARLDKANPIGLFVLGVTWSIQKILIDTREPRGAMWSSFLRWLLQL
jgi:hypothetical protein